MTIGVYYVKYGFFWLGFWRHPKWGKGVTEGKKHLVDPYVCLQPAIRELVSLVSFLLFYHSCVLYIVVAGPLTSFLTCHVVVEILSFLLSFTSWWSKIFQPRIDQSRSIKVDGLHSLIVAAR